MRKPSIVQNEIYVQMEANENRKFDRAGHRPQARVTAPAWRARCRCPSRSRSWPSCTSGA